MGIIEKCTDVYKEYGDNINSIIACNHVNIEINAGEFIAILGASGSGKSTLLNMLGGLDFASSGSIVLDGQELVGLDDDELTKLRREKVGYVFQDYNLIPLLTVYENIIITSQLSNKKMDKDYINELINILGLSGLENRFPSELSGGQQQRVSIARALATKPAIILADEPTGNLDSKNGDNVMNIFRRLVDDMKQTVVMVTHNEQYAQRCDKVFIMEDGVLK